MEFLNAFINAEFIVSTSFHGVAFSILFNKNFLSLGLRNNADRVKSLLLKLDISDRYVESDNLPPLDINYSVVNHNLNEMINKSKRYIDINLK